jgi:hypothetical protein
MAGVSNNWNYPQSSPYYDTNIVDDKFLDFLEYREIPQTPDDIYYELPEVYQYRPDLLAYDLYGDPRLWWVFAARNPNKLGPDPYFNFVTGIGIYIPNIVTLQVALGT